MMMIIVFTLEQGTLIFLSVRYTPIKFNNSYVYPWWGYGIGWFLASSSLIMIPITRICKVAKKEGTLWSGQWFPYDGSDITDTRNLKLCFYVIYLLPASESQRQAC